MTNTSTTTRVRPPMARERLATGIPGVDEVTDGGLRVGGMYMVMGRPGTGKTTFGNQLCFAAARRGERAVYVTLLSESHAAMLQNIEHLGFFDPTLLQDGIVYAGAYDAMRQRKLEGLLQVLRQLLRDHAPSLLVIDGIASARHVGDELGQKEFFAELGVLSSMARCTTVLLANITPEDANGPEHTMVDGLIDLSMQVGDQRVVRWLRVLKLRGGRQVLAPSEMVIDGTGIRAYPSAEEFYARDLVDVPASDRRLPTGIVHLDEMLGGGVLEGSVSMILGYTGSGKTTLGLEYLATGAERGEPGLCFGFYEARGRLVQSAAAAGIDLASHLDSGAVDIVWQLPQHHGLDALAARLIENVDRRGVRRLFIDGIDGLRQATANAQRALSFITAIANVLRARGVTTLFSQETAQLIGPRIEVGAFGYSALVENVIVLEYVQAGADTRRLVSIVKQRASATAREQREFVLGERGLEVDENASGPAGAKVGGSATSIGAARGDRGNRGPGSEP